ncbi:hypothetical protein GCM10027024_22470 [Microbacterium insulae]
MVIVYAGNEFLTGNDVALALVDYSQALARAGAAESIVIPVRDADGTDQEAVFLVGPASQLVAKPVDGAGDELIDEAAVTELKTRTRRLRPSVAGEYIDEWI